MADSKITALTAISTVDPAADPLVIVDVSDTSMAASGTTKKITSNQILGAGGTATLASATITGAATVGTTLGVTGVSTFAAGTALLPALTTTGDTNTGIYYPAADTFAVTTGGAERYRVDSSGNVGVGLTPRVKLDVNGGLLVNNYGTSSNYAPLSVTTDSTITTPSTFTNAINIWNPTTVGAYSNITFGYNALGLTNAPAYIGFVSTTSTSGGFGDLVFGTRSVGTDTAATERVRIDASGNFLVARTSAGLTNGTGVTIGQASIGMQTEGNATQIVVNRTTSDGTIVDIRRNNSTVGTIAVTTTATAYNTSSDYRLKEAAQPLVGGLARVNALKPSTYNWKANGSAGEGFIAHELAEVVPLAVTGDKDAVDADGKPAYQGVDLSKIVPILVAAIQELTAEVNALKNA